jgi:hypothetical protein
MWADARGAPAWCATRHDRSDIAEQLVAARVKQLDAAQDRVLHGVADTMGSKPSRAHLVAKAREVA